MPIYEVDVEITNIVTIKVEAPDVEAAKKRTLYFMGASGDWDQEYQDSKIVNVQETNSISRPFHLPEDRWQDDFAEDYDYAGGQNADV